MGEPTRTGLRSPFVFLALALVVVLLDQGTKFWAVRALTPGIAERYLQRPPSATEALEIRETLSTWDQLRLYYAEVRQPCEKNVGPRCRVVSVIDGFWNFRYVENPGAAFSFLRDAGPALRRPFFLGVSSIASVVLVFLLFSRSRPPWRSAAMALVLGGAVGNLIDRASFGYVIDFIHWHAGSFDWPVFNVADSAIVVGGVALVWLLGRNPKKATPEAAESQEMVANLAEGD